MTNKVPNIRFKGFTDDWEQRKLGELVTFSKGSGYSKGDLLKEGTPIILYGRLYTKYETVISNVDTFVEPKGKSVFSKGGEVIVPGSGETAEDISIASVVEESGVLLGGDLNIITPPKEINSAFLAISISNGKPHKDMAKMAQGKSVVHLHNSDLAKIDFPFPIYEEQCRISNQFAELDNLITLHQRKCEQTKELKKFMLQKMFPKKGEKNPEIRFPGFTDDWEQRKLEDEFSDFIVPMRDKPKEFGGNIPWTRIEDIEGKYLNGTLSNQYVTEDTVKKMNLKIIPKNSLIVSSSATFGVVAVVTQDLITNQTFIGLVPKEIETIDYWYAYFNSDEVKKYMRLQSAGSTIFYIARESFEKMPVTIPSKYEMIKIGQHFNNLDRLITLHQRELEHLKLLKKGLLQQMFI